MHPIIRLAVPVVVAAFLVACDGEKTEPSPTPSPAASASVSPSPTSTATAASPTATSSPTASATPTAFPTGPAGPTPPAGYASSCASTFPWGKQVSRPFVCIEVPARGATVARGSSLTVRGYAGGSFENNVVVEVRLVNASGVLASTPLVQMPQTYVAPDAGMPGYWQAVFTIPAGQPSDARVIAHFESPRDGERVAEASVDIHLR